MIWLNGLFAAFSLLTIFKAPAKPLWYVAIGVTEWGHWLAILSLMLAVTSWHLARRWGVSSWLAIGAALLYLTPLLRATKVAHSLSAQLVSCFGSVAPLENPEARSRPRPLNFLDLFKGIASPPVRISTRIYADPYEHPLSLDLYEPVAHTPGRELCPAVIVVHGGSWQSGDRGDFQALDRYLAARGYLVASIDYRLVPEAAFPSQTEDVFAAITYLKDHAKELNFDKERLVLLGRSAGGQIALAAAYAQKDAAIKGVIAFYTPSDLVWGYAHPTNPLIMNSKRVIENYLGGAPSHIPGRYEAASPLYVVNKTTPATLMIHGGRDELVSPEHDERLSKRLAEAGRPYFYLALPWATHGCDANFSGPCGQLSTYAVERFLAFVIQVKS